MAVTEDTHPQMNPCPLCGSAGRLDYTTGPDDSRMDWWPECTNPDCLLHIACPLFDSEEEAVAAWNKEAKP